MCRSGPKWKREKVADHKFDFIDTRDFTDNGWFMRSKYLFLYLLVLKDFLVYMADIFTAVTMLTTNAWSSEIFEQCEKKKISNCIPIPFETGKWLFVGCIIFSFLLLGYDSFKAKKIIASRDISYAFTNVMANNYYSLRSYDHFCLFEHISNSTKLSDDFAFFVFFAFKTWKRLLLANGPRATIQALTLYAIFLAKKDEKRQWYELDQYLDTKNFSTSALTLTSAFTVLVFSISLLILITAACCYIPLLCHIRGNLKEYCCHKVDKRISELIKRKQKQRLVEAAKLAHKEAKGDFSHLKNKKGQMVAQPLPQPTLPNLSVDDDDDISTIPKSKAAAGSTYTYNPNEQYYYDSKNDYPPPMPPYNPYSQHQAPGAPQYQSSQASLYEENSGYYNNGNTAGYDINDNESTAHLTAGSNQQPYGGYSQSPIERPGTTGPYNRHDGYSIERPGTTGPHNNMYDPHDVYQGRTGSATESRRHSPPQSTGTPQPYEYSNHSQSQTLYETSPNTYNSGGYSHQQYSSQQQPGRYGGGGGGGYAV